MRAEERVVRAQLVELDLEGVGGDADEAGDVGAAEGGTGEAVLEEHGEGALEFCES